MSKNKFPLGAGIVAIGLVVLFLDALRKTQSPNRDYTGPDGVPLPGSEIGGLPGFFHPSPPYTPP